MVSLLNDTWALTRRMQSGVPPEERRQVMSNMHSNIMVLTPLLNNERDRELYDMAMGLGHSDADAASVVQYVNQIVSNTSVRTLIPGGGRGGFHPPGGGNPFGR
jgi:hypothetical protein